VGHWGLTVSVCLLVTSVTSSLLSANADVKNVWNVISNYTFIHNVSVQSRNTKTLNWYKYWTLSVALCFVTTHWFWLLALLVSEVPKQEYGIFSFGRMKLKTGLCLCCMKQGQLAKCWLQTKAYKVEKVQCSFLFTPFCYRLSDTTENVACNWFNKIQCCYIIVKVIAVFIKWCQKFKLFFMLSINNEVSSHEIFNIKRGLDCRRECCRTYARGMWFWNSCNSKQLFMIGVHTSYIHEGRSTSNSVWL
jgi:hypothetical protein